MSNEVTWQGKVVKAINGIPNCYARKASNAYASGVLDLMVSVGSGAMFIECKFEKDFSPDWTSRKLGYTTAQKIEATRLKVSGAPAFGLVFAHFGPSKIFLVPMPMPEIDEDAYIRPSLDGGVESYVGGRTRGGAVLWREHKDRLGRLMDQWSLEHGR